MGNAANIAACVAALVEKWVANQVTSYPVKMGAGKQKGKGKDTDRSRPRQRTTGAIERRALRGVAKRAEADLREQEARGSASPTSCARRVWLKEVYQHAAKPTVLQSMLGQGSRKSFAKRLEEKPGTKARRPYAQEEGGRRVAQVSAALPSDQAQTSPCG